MSIVIPTLNGERFLGDQLTALADQASDLHFEVIVADNGSTDGTIEVASSFATQLDLTIIDASAVPGQTYARNLGVRNATADRILFLDQDDVVRPGYVASMTAALDQSELVAAAVETRSLNPGWRSEVRSLAQERELPHEVLPWAYGCTLGITRNAFERVGGFDTSLRSSAEDVDFCWRLHDLGVTLQFIPSAVLCYRFPATYGGLFRQGRRYGIGQAVVNRKHRALGIKQLSLSQWSRRSLGALKLVIAARSRADRGRGFFLVGRRLGMMEGALRARGEQALTRLGHRPPAR